MRNYKLTIAYDGSRYRGWQRQPDTDLTIQGILETCISDVIGYPVLIAGAGRTDGGVHAKGQVATVLVSGKLDEQNFRDAINSRLPEDIRILRAELVKNGFHSRVSAVAKQYVYTIDTREKADVFSRKYACHYPKSLNIEEMKRAAEALTGTHNFLSFTDKKELDSAVRTIYDITVTTREDKIRISYYGTGFLYHMVRILTGTLLEVGEGTRSADEIPSILAKEERSAAGFLAPAQGLCLQEVYYKEEKRK